MEKMVIEGGFPLNGKVRVNGAKNAALPIMAACLLLKGTSKLKGIPELTDVSTLCKILNELGADTVKCPDGSLDITVRDDLSLQMYQPFARFLTSSVQIQ